MQGGVPLPEGYHSVNPYIVADDAERLIDFLVQVFGAVEQGRSLRPDGRIDHADVRIGDSLVMLSEASQQYPARPCVHFVYVPDVDATYRAALAAGATSILKPSEQSWGDRVCGVVDPFDNRWWVATRLREFSLVGWGDRVTDESMVDRVTAELGRAGLPSRTDMPALGGFGVEPSTSADPPEVAAYVVWNTADELAEPAFDRLGANDLEHRAVLHMGRILEAMTEAMRVILVSAGLDARLSTDDLAPATVVVYARADGRAMDGSAVEVWNAATALGPSGTVGPDVPPGTAQLARLLRSITRPWAVG